MICGDCKHWQGNDTEAQAKCKRYPPEAGGVVAQQTLSGPQPVIIWAQPETGRGDWCGEWVAQIPKLSLVS